MTKHHTFPIASPKDGSFLRINASQIFLIIVLILVSYSNTFQASWHLDDLPNITANSPLHIDDFSLSTLSKTFFANPIEGRQGTMHRPVAMLSFAINWYLDKDNTLYYHVVNISIHIISALFLYLTISHLFTKTTHLITSRTPPPFTLIIAFLATLLWALNPIQTQAITYIVQRMASMAAMFYIIAIFFYLMGRAASKFIPKAISFAIAFSCFLFAIGCKENVYTLPIALIIIELVFLQDLKQKKVQKKFFFIFFFTSIVFFLLGSQIFLHGDPLSFLSGYNARSFSLSERLLTEPRVVLNYLYQIFYPITSQLSFEHDIILSQSLFKPWTTLPAIFSLILLLLSALITLRRFPFYSFAILFFFLNHIIESSVFPLEIVFEHRNYLPSMFLFVPIAQVLVFGVYSLQKKSPLLSNSLIIFSALLVLLFGFSTYSRNEVWATEGTLWEDTYSKAPESSRAAHNLGRWYREHGQFDKALNLFKQAEIHSPQASSPKYTMANALNGQGTIYYYTDSPDRAIKTFRRALDAFPRFEASRKNLALTLLKTEQYPEALDESLKLIAMKPDVIEYIYIHALALLQNQKPEQSLTFLKKGLEAAPNNTNLLLTSAATYKALKQYDKAKYFLYKSDKLDPGKLLVGLALLEISTLENDNDSTKNLIAQIQTKFTPETIDKFVSEVQFIPLFSKNIVNVLSQSKQ